MNQELRITFTGRTPLLCHNERLANPDDPIAREIAAITSKQKKTEDDRKAVFRLEWFGGLYTAPDISGPVAPTKNLRKCLIDAAKTLKLGTAVTRALNFTTLNVPIAYDGPRDLDALYATDAFTNISMVRVRGRVPRCRPMFPQWVIVADAVLLADILDLDVFRRIGDLAGMAEGLGDNRKNGYGRFDVGIAKR